MLKLARSVRDINLAALMAVYSKTEADYLEERKFCLDLLAFFEEARAVYALWVEEGGYCAALRLEPYQDGLLVAGLETDPTMRNRGYATKLLEAVVQEMRMRLYSHVARNNKASLKVHLRCGFSVILDHAVYLDGSVSHGAVTMCTFS